LIKNEPGAKLDEVKDIFVLAFEERMRAIAREVFAEQVRQEQRAAVSLVGDPEAHGLREALKKIRAKDFITIREAHVLLGCSDGHIRNLVDKARKGKAAHPIPFLDLDGVTVFPLAKLLEWAERPKTRRRATN